jgi:hypothetical protein
MNFSGFAPVAARGSALPVSYRKLGSANGSRTRCPPVQFSLVGSKWLSFQYSWYSEMLRNTATDRRRHSAVTAQTRAEGRGRGRRASEIA